MTKDQIHYWTLIFRSQMIAIDKNALSLIEDELSVG